MEMVKMTAMVFGASGFWKVLEILFERNKQKAEISHLNSQVNSQIISNWVSWSQKLEDRVKDLEGRNQAMNKTIELQKESIQGLEKQVSLLEDQNTTLKEEVDELKAINHGNG